MARKIFDVHKSAENGDNHDRNHISSDVQMCLEATFNHHLKKKKKMQFWNVSRVQSLLNLKSSSRNDHVLTEDGVFICCWPLMISIYHITDSK